MNDFEQFRWPGEDENAQAWRRAKELTFEEARAQFPPMWVIYDHPRDFPKSWVVRRWYGPHPDHSWLAIAPSLQAARDAACIAGGNVMMDRSPGDDPVIVEVWL